MISFIFLIEKLKCFLIFINLYSFSLLILKLSFYKNLHNLNAKVLGETRIINGRRANLSEFPYIVSLHIRGEEKKSLFCAGSILSSYIILTAAHCLEPGVNNIVVVPNYNNKGRANETNKVYNIVRACIHQGYSNRPFLQNYHDLSLLWLDEPVSFNEQFCPIRTIDKSWNSPNATIAGWGKTSSRNLKTNDYMMTADIEIKDEKVCSKLYEDWAFGSICAGDRGKDSCDGDSGGPLVLRHPQFPCLDIQIGIISFGEYECGVQPAGYVPLLVYNQWIKMLTHEGTNNTYASQHDDAGNFLQNSTHFNVNTSHCTNYQYNPPFQR